MSMKKSILDLVIPASVLKEEYLQKYGDRYIGGLKPYTKTFGRFVGKVGLSVKDIFQRDTMKGSQKFFMGITFRLHLLSIFAERYSEVRQLVLDSMIECWKESIDAEIKELEKSVTSTNDYWSKKIAKLRSYLDLYEENPSPMLRYQQQRKDIDDLMFATVAGVALATPLGCILKLRHNTERSFFATMADFQNSYGYNRWYAFYQGFLPYLMRKIGVEMNSKLICSHIYL